MSGHHRSLPLYCVIGADALSRAGNTMTTIAIPLIVLNQGYSAAEVGLSSAAASLPIVIGALAGGSFADRIGYRTTSVISDAASGVTVLVLGLLAQLHMLPLWPCWRWSSYPISWMRPAREQGPARFRISPDWPAYR